jgi:hypothetical protein
VPPQDTPGFGDDLNIMNNITTMLEHIENQNNKWLQVPRLPPPPPPPHPPAPPPAARRSPLPAWPAP